MRNIYMNKKYYSAIEKSKPKIIIFGCEKSTRKIIVTMNWAIQLCIAFRFYSFFCWENDLKWLAHTNTVPIAQNSTICTHRKGLKDRKKGARYESMQNTKNATRCVMCIGHNNRYNYWCIIHERLFGVHRFKYSRLYTLFLPARIALYVKLNS